MGCVYDGGYLWVFPPPRLRHIRAAPGSVCLMVAKCCGLFLSLSAFYRILLWFSYHSPFLTRSTFRFLRSFTDFWCILQGYICLPEGSSVPCFNIKSFRYGDSHYKDRNVERQMGVRRLHIEMTPSAASYCMLKSWYGNPFRITCSQRWIPLITGSKTEQGCFIWWQQSTEQTVGLPRWFKTTRCSWRHRNGLRVIRTRGD